MKKIVCLLVALMLCLSSAAFAESVPSKTTGDLTKFEVAVENAENASGFYVAPVAESDDANQDRAQACQAEISKLVASEKVAAYFGEVKDAAGNTVSLTEVLGTDTLNVHEFCAIKAGGFDEQFGKVTANMLFSTPYAAGEKVIVMIGIVTINADGTQTVAWTAYEGVGVQVDSVENQGCIQVALDPATVLAIQQGTALLAIVSK